MYDIGSYIMKEITLRYIEERMFNEKGNTCDCHRAFTYCATT